MDSLGLGVEDADCLPLPAEHEGEELLVEVREGTQRHAGGVGRGGTQQGLLLCLQVQPVVALVGVAGAQKQVL